MLDVTSPNQAASAMARAEPKPRSLWSDAWRRLRRNKAALLGLTMIIVLMLVPSSPTCWRPTHSASSISTRPSGPVAPRAFRWAPTRRGPALLAG